MSDPQSQSQSSEPVAPREQLQQADTYKVPRLCFVNKMDRAGASFVNALASIRERLGANAVAITPDTAELEREEVTRFGSLVGK